MASVTRVNGSGQYDNDTLFGVANLKAVLVTVKEDDGTAVDLGAQDGLGASEVAEQLVEAIVRECQPLMYYFDDANGSSNTIHMIVDGHAVDAATLQARIRNLGAVNADERNFVSQDGDGTTTTIDIGGTTAAVGTAITVT